MRSAGARAHLLRRGRMLEVFTVLWNSAEGTVGVLFGLLAGSIALVGFGLDSFIEMSSGLILLWRLQTRRDAEAAERTETTALRLVGVSLLVLAGYIAYESLGALIRREPPDASIPGIVLAVVSLVVMPLLSREKRRLAAALQSRALAADSLQTDICTVLSAILLGGLLANGLWGWWWADPVAALVMTPFIAWEGRAAWRGEQGAEAGRCIP